MVVTRTRRLSRRARWLVHEPICRQAGHLYFRLTFPITQWGYGHARYIQVKGKQRVYWMNHLLHNTNATEVEIIKASITD